MHKKTIREILVSNLEKRMALDSTIAKPVLLASRAGVDQGHLSRVLNLKASPTVDLVDRLARACRCQAWELLVDGDETREAYIRKALKG